MTTPELIEFFGFLVGAWGIGFASGYTISVFKKAIDRVS